MYYELKAFSPGKGKWGDRMFCLRCLGFLSFLFFFKPNCSPGVFIFCFEIKLYHSPQPSGWSLRVNSVWNWMTTAMMLSVFVLLTFPIPIPQTRGQKKGCVTYLSWHRRVIEAWRTKETWESLNLLPGRAYHRDVAVGSLCVQVASPACQPSLETRLACLVLSCPCKQSRGPCIHWVSEHSERGFLGFWAKTMEIFKTENRKSLSPVSRTNHLGMVRKVKNSRINLGWVGSHKDGDCDGIVSIWTSLELYSANSVFFNVSEYQSLLFRMNSDWS